MGTKGKRMAGNDSKPEKVKKEKVKKNREEKQNKEAKKKMGIGKKIIIALLVIILIFAIIFGVLVYFASSILGKVGYEKLDESQLSLNDVYSEVSNQVSKQEFDSIKNIALLGIDGGRSDSIIIASINQTDHTIKLISVPRDTYVKVEGHGKTKINHAYAYGKEQLALKTINENFGLNVSEYVTINFRGLINIINKIGGIELEITKAEMNYINEKVNESYALTKKSVKKVTSYGKVTLTGEQALTHARNRTVGNDFTREERQRDVITAVMEKVSKMGATQILGLSDSILSEVKTNLNIGEWTGILTGALGNSNEYLSNIISKQIPSEEEGNGSGRGQMIDGIYYFVVDLEETSTAFKNIIYGE